jgi:hypothetical protein
MRELTPQRKTYAAVAETDNARLPSLIVWMHPNIGRDLALHRQPDHVHRAARSGLSCMVSISGVASNFQSWRAR